MGSYETPNCTYGCPDGSISGVVRNEQNNPLNGAAITLHRIDQWALNRTVYSDGSGAYSLTNVAAGTYEIWVSKTGYIQITQTNWTIGCNEPQTLWFTMHPLDFSISSVDVFQTVLYFQPEPLIANKATVVIVPISNPNHINGYVRARLTMKDNGVPVPGFEPMTSSVFWVKPSYSVQDAENWTDALYFTIMPPPRDHITFEVQLLSEDGTPHSAPIQSAEHRFVRSRDLTLRFIPITTADHRNWYQTFSNTYMNSTSDRLRGMLPYSNINFSLSGTPVGVLSSSTDPLVLGEVRLNMMAWLALNGIVSADVFYVCMMPTWSIDPSNPGLIGQSGRLCLPFDAGRFLPLRYCVFVGTQADADNPVNASVVAHELGHSIAGLNLCEELYQPGVCERPSRPCELDFWGLNTHPMSTCTLDRMSLKSGSGSHDIMTDGAAWGFCNTWVRWDSTYRKFKELALGWLPPLKDNIRLEDAGPYCVISGIVARDHSAAPLFQVENFAGEYTPVLLDSGVFHADWYDAEWNTLLQTLYFDPVFERREGLLDYADFFIVTSRPANARNMILYDGDTEVGRITGTGAVPQVSLAAPNGGESLLDSTIVRWTASDADLDSLQFDVFANRDGGNWEPLAMGIRDTFLVWHVNYFPGTNAGRVKVVASDGWNNSADSSDGTFTVAMHNPVAHIESPQDTATILASSYVSLSGQASDLEDGNIPYDSLSWNDGANPVGIGSLIQVDSLAPGLHTITLMAIDRDGNAGYAYAHVNVLADNDRDGMSDAWEAAHHLDTTRNDAYADYDLDGLTNGQEYNLGTFPDNTDTDNDGHTDGEEVARGSDPLDAASIPTTVSLTNPTAISSIGTLGFNDPVIFIWSASSADDSLRPIRYEVQVDADPNFSNPLVIFADTLLSITSPWQLSVGLTYSWKVKATDLYGHWVWSNIATFTRGHNPQVPVRVTDLTAQVVGDTLWLHWSPVTVDTSGNPVTVGLYIISAAPAVDAEYLPIAYTTTNAWTDTAAFNLEWPTWFYVVEGSTDQNPPQIFSRRNWPGMEQMRRTRD